MGLSFSVCTFIKICGEEIFTLCCKVHVIRKTAAWTEHPLLLIKVPNLGALTLSKVSEERGGNLSHLGPNSSSGCDSGGSALCLLRWEKLGYGAAHCCCASLESMRSLGGPGSVDWLCRRHSEEQSQEYHKTEVKGIFEVTPQMSGQHEFTSWCWLGEHRGEKEFLLCCVGAQNALGLWMKITSWNYYVLFFNVEKLVVQYHCLCHFIAPRNSHKK